MIELRREEKSMYTLSLIAFHSVTFINHLPQTEPHAKD